MIPDMHHLAVFNAIAAEGGITAAARRLAKSPPAVHHALKQFERRMGRPLFERVGRRLRLTADGRAYHREIERALTGIERATRQWSGASAHLRPLRLGAVSGFGRFRLYPRLLKLAPPERPIEILLDSQDAIVAALLREEIDLAVIYKPIVAAQIETRAVAEEELVLIAPLGTPRLRMAAELLKQHFVTYQEYEYVFGRWFHDVLGKQPAALNRLDHSSELDEALAAVASGRGITIAPRDAWANGPWREQTRAVRIAKKACHNALYLAAVGGGLSSEDARLLTRAASATAR
jgi:DNA-binding transcriptional LysR family regulator